MQENKLRESKYRNFKQIVNTFYNEEIKLLDDKENAQVKNAGNITIEPTIIYDKFSNNIKVEFKIGNKNMYKIKDLSAFYDRMVNKELYKYGSKLQFLHTKEAFCDTSQKLLDFILKYSEVIKYANSNSNINYRYYGKALNDSNIILGNTGIDEFFDILIDKKAKMNKDLTITEIEFLDKNPEIIFKLIKSEDEYVIVSDIDIFKFSIIKGKSYKYLLDDKAMYRCSKEFENTNLKLLEIFRQNYITEAKFGNKELRDFFSIVMPKMKDAIKLDEIDYKQIEPYIPKKLNVKVFLDYDEMLNIISDVRFCYGENEFNPLDERNVIEIPRNLIGETKALNMFKKSGFMYDAKNLRFILPEEDKIYQFISNDISYYMKSFEVLVTDSFKIKQIKEPKINNLGVKIENNLLYINLEKLNVEKEELEDILKKYSLKKKYYRLKDGSFLSLENNKELDFLDKLVTGVNIDYSDLKSGEIKLPINKSLYLNRLLKSLKGTNVTKNKEYKEIIHGMDKDNTDEVNLPYELEKTLRHYQKTGFKWLKVLDSYKFGGILADDMGLGKTIQIISIILQYVNNELQLNRKPRASLVISPSSLTLNWFSEAEKFANKLNVLVIKGNAEERKIKINNIENYDLVITSYDSLKRDIELYKQKNYNFRYVIADEAQYLKNSNTQNAKSIKDINADTRYALTGTPIENSLAELWSIFDFIMPGYLDSYKKFRNLYEIPIVKDEDTRALDKLKMLIEPFVLRRTKKEVLTELPEKSVAVLNNEMKEEQRNIYLTYLAQVKQDIFSEITSNGYGKSQIKILAALTRLRQICCHPSLFIEDYNQGSGKLEQCIEIIEEASSSGHKILVFSSYTSMFKIMESELINRNIRYFKLTGSTKIDERIKLVNEFNENIDIKVFLISLKAGGTGLNLTGADMVIHYDPWWNISTENQATDRAYRIGQINNVQVYKLITKNSIEEKIYELQRKKQRLMDNMLDTNTSFINKLSEEDVMKLFD